MTGISIIIPTLNRTTFLKDTLDDLFVQEFEHPYEILIVDQSTQPDEVILKHIQGKPNVRYYHITQFRGLPEARNFGWQNAVYDYVLYVDDDIQCQPNLLSEHYKYLTDPEIGIVAGGITEKNNPNTGTRIGVFEKIKANPITGFHKKGQLEVEHAKGCNYSTKTSILKSLKGTDQNLTKGAALYEELDYCLRVKKAGYKIFFNSEAHVVHLAAAAGGCRVEEIDKYLYSLVRNRSLIIERHITGFYKITAELYLFKLFLAYVWSYKKTSLFKVYRQARNEGKKAAKQPVKCTNWNE
jgi:GT2 family glycosyltransferase